MIKRGLGIWDNIKTPLYGTRYPLWDNVKTPVYGTRYPLWGMVKRDLKPTQKRPETNRIGLDHPHHFHRLLVQNLGGERCIHIHTHVYIYIHMYTYTYTCIHIHTHVYIYIHMYTYTYTCIQEMYTYTYTCIHIRCPTLTLSVVFVDRERT